MDFISSYACVLRAVNLPYGSLFLLGANFPEFHEWAHYLGKFILGYYMKFDYGSLLQKL